MAFCSCLECLDVKLCSLYIHSLSTRHLEVTYVHMLYLQRCSTELAEILRSVHHLQLVGEFINGKQDESRTRRDEQRINYSKMDKRAKDKLVRSPGENGGG